MNFEEACGYCHVRSGIYHPSDKSHIIYWKNHPITLEIRVPEKLQKLEGWLEYDPRDDDETSLFMFND